MYLREKIKTQAEALKYIEWWRVIEWSRVMAIETYHFGERKCGQRGQTYLPASVSWKKCTYFTWQNQ